MKNVILILFFISPSILFGQPPSTNLYGGLNMGLKKQVYLNTTLEHKDQYMLVQISYLGNFYSEDFLNLKMGFRVLNLKKNQIEWYLYAPYLNFSIREKAYNTPFSTELFYKETLSLNFDVYKNGVYPSFRWRIKIL